MAEYPNVQVTYTQGAPPNLFMKDAEGNVVEEIGISNWKLECVLHAPKAALRLASVPCGAPSSCPTHKPARLFCVGRQAHPRVLCGEACASRGGVSHGPAVRSWDGRELHNTMKHTSPKSFFERSRGR